ncbi:unnamed protein product, partial [Mesorhabditis belari]|uniref:Uncharacterized protein n=1 Tax=Mesorhabditis belari TaxID=2138241 RepID=A0AAF3FH67_9BILA
MKIHSKALEILYYHLIASSKEKKLAKLSFLLHFNPSGLRPSNFPKFTMTDLTEANKIINKLENQLREKKKVFEASGEVQKNLDALEKQTDYRMEKIRVLIDKSRHNWREQLDKLDDDEKIRLRRQESASTKHPISSLNSMNRLEFHMNAVGNKVNKVDKACKSLPVPMEHALFGLNEIAHVYNDANTKLDSMLQTIHTLKKMPEFYNSAPQPGGLHMKEDIDYALHVLEAFRTKMRISTSDYDHRVKEAANEPGFQLDVDETTPFSVVSEESLRKVAINKT